MTMDTAPDSNAYPSDAVQDTTNPAPTLPLLRQPSTWSGLWVLAALVWLSFSRRSLGRAG